MVQAERVSLEQTQVHRQWIAKHPQPSCVRRPSVEKRTQQRQRWIMEELAIREGWLAERCTGRK